MPNYAVLDSALELLRDTAPELRNGAPNHGPMVAEALIALGREDVVDGWIGAASQRLLPGPTTNAELLGDWAKSLGDMDKLGAWQNFFSSELSNAHWVDVIERWIPRLIPGCMATGTHGMIRCGHAVRALDHGQTALRLEELAHALAYSAASYRQIIPSVPRLEGALDLERAVANLPLLEPDTDRTGLPPRVVERLANRSDFAAAIQQLAAPQDIDNALTTLSEIGALLYLHDADRHPLVLLHAVTGPAAVQLFIHHLSSEASSIVFAYTWQAIAAWAAAFSSGVLRPFASVSSASWDDIVDRSVESGDPHAVKLTEACKRQGALQPSPAFRAAADDWAIRVLESKNRSFAELAAVGIALELPERD